MFDSYTQSEYSVYTFMNNQNIPYRQELIKTIQKAWISDLFGLRNISFCIILCP